MTDTADNARTDTATATGEQESTTKETDTVEFWKAKAREQEKRAKSNADAAERLARYEESQKTEAQRLTEAKDAAEQDAISARAEALRYRIASQYGINGDDAETFLTGTDEATLTHQAERLATLAKPGTTAPAPRADLSQGARSGTPQPGDPATDFATFMKSHLNK